MDVLAAENPLQEGIFIDRMAEPCALVIFGASGDLTKRKLIPALYDLAVDRHLPVGITIIGCARTPMSHDAFRDKMRQEAGKYARHVPLDAAAWNSFAQRLFYVSSNFEEPYSELAAQFRELVEGSVCTNNWLLYMTTPPTASLKILRGLRVAGLAAGHSPGLSEAPAAPGWTRVVVEKPFGHSLQESRELNQMLSDLFREEQIYRIDHYLGKEAVQNILALRFANRIFEPVWNNRYIDHVQITVAETVGVEQRGGYYEGSGALRDMVANHMLQVLSLVAMEPPAALSADAVRDEKVKALHSIQRMRPETIADLTVRAQYAEGWAAGAAAAAYRAEPAVSAASRTETFCALKLQVNNWRWGTTPFYLRTGKRLAKRVSEVAIQFRELPHMLFPQTAADQIEPNLLILRIQPDEGVSLRFEAELPGPQMRLRSLNMDFHYGSAFGFASPEAYERLLSDCMLGDSTLFSRRDAVEASWEVVMPILDAWSASTESDLPTYPAGTWGPLLADRLLERDGRRWHRL